uniref:Uncharacterized protein n=1 Tax=Oryza glaberrima TaxID=4538 RepID=I1QU83_ORYGL
MVASVPEAEVVAGVHRRGKQLHGGRSAGASGGGRSGAWVGAGGGGSSGPGGAAPLPSPSSSSSSSLALAPATAGKEYSSLPPARSRTKWTAAGRPAQTREREREEEEEEEEEEEGSGDPAARHRQAPPGVMRRVMKRRRKSRGRRRGRWGCRRAAPDESLSGSAKAMIAAASTFDMMDDKVASAAEWGRGETDAAEAASELELEMMRSRFYSSGF